MLIRTAIVVILLFLLGACGQKGDLYLRDDTQAPSSGQESADPDPDPEQGQEQVDEEQEDEE